MKDWIIIVIILLLTPVLFEVIYGSILAKISLFKVIARWFSALLEITSSLWLIVWKEKLLLRPWFIPLFPLHYILFWSLVWAGRLWSIKFKKHAYIFVNSKGVRKYNKLARYIGQIIYILGGQGVMFRIAYALKKNIEYEAYFELNECWNGIGEWKS